VCKALRFDALHLFGGAHARPESFDTMIPMKRNPFSSPRYCERGCHPSMERQLPLKR
jgi:hypothetical protein